MKEEIKSREWNNYVSKFNWTLTLSNNNQQTNRKEKNKKCFINQKCKKDYELGQIENQQKNGRYKTRYVSTYIKCKIIQ